MKSVSQLRSFSDSSSSTTAVAEQESDEEEDDGLEEVRGCVSIRKSSESQIFQCFVILADGPFFTLEEDESKDGEEVDEDEGEDEGEDDGAQVARDRADHVL